MQWLHLLSGLGLGACLADDMGLGKTIQVLALLLAQARGARAASLLVAPASLLANWAAEIERFAPDLKAAIVHPSAMTAEQIGEFTPARGGGLDLAITSYGSLLRMPALAEIDVALAILDEAQAIKNPGAKQTRAAKALKAHGAHRADRHAGREPPRRPVVDLRFHQSGPARDRRSSSAATPRRWPIARAIRTARCASWCGPTSCGA